MMLTRAASRRRHCAAAFPLVGTLLLAACTPPAAVATTDNSALTPQEIAVQNAARNYQTTQVEGAGLGAIVGASIGYWRGGARGALIGGAAGAAAGTLAGTLVAQNNYAQAQNENTKSSAIADAEKSAQDFAADAQQAQALVQSVNLRIADYQSQLKANAITQDQYAGKLASMRSDIAALDQISAGAQAKINALRKSANLANGSDSGQFAKAADEVGQAKAEIDRQNELLKQSLSAQPT